jgi:acetylornithine deacetylase/succinyl-diaminopimelate desuccinylase family protein
MSIPREPVVQLLADLVAIPSMNPMGKEVPAAQYSEKELSDFLTNYLTRNGIDAEVYDASPGRPNVLGYVDAGAAETLLLEAHMDTVHARGMTIEPFTPVVKEGRLFGRGSCDTKGSLAAFLESVLSLLREGKRLKYNVRFLFVSDEEYRFTGAQAAVRNGLKATFGIVGEPTGLSIVRAHKGVTRWRIRTEGAAAHSAFPERGRNAIYLMGEVIRRLERYAQELSQQGSFADLGVPTLSIGVIEGGSAVNVVPDSCWIEIDRRTLPGETIEQIMRSVATLLAELPHVRIDPPHISVLGMSVQDSAPIISMLSESLKRAGVEVAKMSAPYATDAGIYNTAGIPTVVFGPGDIAQAHTETEFIDLGQLQQAVSVLRYLIMN